MMHINKSWLMECMGTFFFILTIAMGLHPFAIASMLMAWLYIGGYVSGAHYNPMVSLAVKIRENSSWSKFIQYALAQIVGGFLAYSVAGHLQGGITIPAPGADATLLQAFVVEILLAFVLASVILTVATTAPYKNSNIFGFAIGLSILALAALGTPISGGLFNPAIALGASLAGLVFYGIPVMFNHLLMYVAGACIGGALAAKSCNYFENK